MGDFNLGRINWENLTGDRASVNFLDTVQDSFLHQFVEEPTRGDNILDLVLSNGENLVRDIEVGGHLGISDQREIRFNIECEGRRKENNTEVPNFRQADFHSMRYYLRQALQADRGGR